MEPHKIPFNIFYLFLGFLLIGGAMAVLHSFTAGKKDFEKDAKGVKVAVRAVNRTSEALHISEPKKELKESWYNWFKDAVSFSDIGEGSKGIFKMVFYATLTITFLTLVSYIGYKMYK